MQPHSNIEISVGAFVIIGALSLGYLAITLGDLRLGGNPRYTLQARFSSVGELKSGAEIKLAGVHVGEVGTIELSEFAADAQLQLQDGLKLPDDTIASIQTAGLLGDAYVSLSAGASDKDLAAGGRITRTEPAVSLMELLAKYAFGSPLSEDAAPGAPSPNAQPGDARGAQPAGADRTDRLE